jgi:hypothetical protein
MVFSPGFSENSSFEIDKVVVDLTNWNNGYPTGALAYDGPDVVCSEYCFDPDGFKEFFDDVKGYFSYTDPVLEVRTDAHDLTGDNASLISMVKDLQSSFDNILASRENTIDYYPITDEEVDLFMKAKDDFETLAREKGLISEDDDFDNSLDFD